MLIQFIKETISINSHYIKLKFDFKPNYSKYEIIGESAKKEPKIVVRFESISDTADLKFEILTSSQINRFERKLDDQKRQLEDQKQQLDDQKRLFDSQFNDQKAEIRGLSDQIKNLTIEIQNSRGDNIVHPLLDFVAKFRVKIVDEMVKEGLVIANEYLEQLISLS